MTTTTTSLPAFHQRRAIILWILSILICCSVMFQFIVVPHRSGHYQHWDPLLREGQEFLREAFLDSSSSASSRVDHVTTTTATATASSRTQKEGITSSSSHQESKSSSSNDSNNNNNEDRPVTLHIIFSTSCSDQMLWESYVFFYHAWKVQQPGHVTRIASGCNAEQAEKLQAFHQRSIAIWSPNFHLHLTPDFSKVRKDMGKFPYKYMNKPFGVRHWMERVLGMDSNSSSTTTTASNPNSYPYHEDDVVILMDPDMILLRPIGYDYTDDPSVIWADANITAHPLLTKRVRHGFPMAQQDGYLSNEWMQYNTSYIVQDNPNFTMVHSDDGPRYYNTGPPYLATVRDMYRIAVLWTEYAPRVFDDHPVLFAEMYGYVLATVQLKLPHTLMKSIVVSTTETTHREGWPLVDALPDDQLCHPPSHVVSRLPIGLHYCKRYYAGQWFFSKYRLKKNYISCQAPIMASPPSDIHHFDYWIQPPKDTDFPWGLRTATLPFRNHKQVRRETFMLCGLISAINEAAIYYKQHFCQNDTAVNWNNTYTVHDSPTDY